MRTLTTALCVIVLAVSSAYAADKEKETPAAKEESPKAAKKATGEETAPKSRSSKESTKESTKESKKESTKESGKEAAKEPSKEALKEAARERRARAKLAREEREEQAKAGTKGAPVAGLPDQERAAFEETIRRLNAEIATRTAPKLALAAKATQPIKLTSSNHSPSQAPGAAAPGKSASAHAAPGAAGAHQALHAHWSYEGAGGPERWGALNPAWSTCEKGTRQSPIDIRDGVKVDLDPIRFEYKPSRFNVVDNGHTIQVNLGSGNAIHVMGRSYELVQFHFHMPAEERVNGRGFEMVAHLVHKDQQGRLAVVAVLIERGVNPHPLVQAVWNNLPLERNEPLSGANTMDLNELLPEARQYYTYMGSLTTPPCSEGVLWLVLKQPIQASPTQVSIFSRLYPMNARPIQTQAGRLIKESN